MSFGSGKFWTIGGGKGGVGKSLLAASLGTALARAGKSVTLVDANLTAPDLHAYLGIKTPGLTLMDVLENRATLSDALAPTPEPQLRFLGCVGDELGMADLAPGIHERMTECLDALASDFVLIDVGSGTACNVLDFFNRAHQAIVVTTPDPAAMRCTFRFIRNAAYRRVQNRFGANEEVSAAMRRLCHSSGNAQPRTMSHFLELLKAKEPATAQDIAAMLDDWQPLLLVNMATSDQDLRSAEIIESAARKFLDVDLRTCGLIHFHAIAHKSGHGMNLPDFAAPDDALAQQIRQMAERLAAIGMPDKEARQAENAAAAPAMGLNDNLAFMGRALHIQTEDLGAAGNCITTQVFCNGRVLLSTRSEYPSDMRTQKHQDKLCELMRTQHFNVIRQIESRRAGRQSAIA